MILLHTTKYGDSSLILHGYSRENGRESYLLRSAGKRAKSLHSLCILDVVTSPTKRGANESGGLVHIKEIVPRYKLSSLRTDMYKISIAMYMSELLYRGLRTSEGDASLYDFLESAVLALDTVDTPFSNFHLWFTVGFASHLGFFPSEGFVKEFNPFSTAERDLLIKISTKPIEEVMAIPMNGEGRSAFIHSLLKYLEYHLGTRLDIRSLSVLHKILLYLR